jgi:hypothetical protein
MRSPRQNRTRLPSVTLTKLADGFGLQSNPKLSLFKETVIHPKEF